MADFIRNFIDTNRVIILFVYGQIFFVLGLVIVLQSWRYSRLALARSLKWLAAFGILHGLHEWGDVFIPVQAQFLTSFWIDALLGVQVVLLAVSFFCLFQFGVEMLRPLPNRLWLLRYLPVAVLVLWFMLAGGAFFSNSGDWVTVSAIFARYSMGFTGAILAAYGLRRQAQSLIAPLEMPRIWRTLQMAGLALAGYGIFAGLVTPPASFFPANWLNSTALEQITLIPVQIYRSVLGLILMLAMLRVLEVFQVELDRQIRGLEEAQMIIAERERIGRELHDGTLQTIYATGLLLKSVERELIKHNSSEMVINRIRQVVDMLDEAVTEIRTYIGVLRDSSNTKSLATGLQELAKARHLRSMVEVDLKLDLPPQRSMSSARVGHLLAITNEALSNVMRHAGATRVIVSATSTDGQLKLGIQDNGQGLPNDYLQGFGLKNMRERARLLGGEMSIESRINFGTTISVEVPWSEENEYITFNGG